MNGSDCGCGQGAVVVTIKQLGGDYGLQKLFGTFGAIIWGPLSGQVHSHRGHFTDPDLSR